MKIRASCLLFTLALLATYTARANTLTVKNLNDATWTDVSGDVTPTNSTASQTDIVPADAPQRFYRVEMFR